MLEVGQITSTIFRQKFEEDNRPDDCKQLPLFKSYVGDDLL